jgi:hypothetical protein
MQLAIEVSMDRQFRIQTATGLRNIEFDSPKVFLVSDHYLIAF